jgi:dTMP kinase
MVEQLNHFAAGDCIPDLTFVLDVDLKTARSRMQAPRRPDRMELQSDDFYERVREGYRALAARERERVMLIDGTQPPDKIDNQIWQILSSRFPALPGNQQTAISNQKL